MSINDISADEICKLYAPLFRIGLAGETPEHGFTRLGWSQEEDEAMDYIRREAEQIGLTARTDAIGNLALEQPGYTEYAETGSHVDTVVRGGNYDGAGGVVCGLAAIRAILASGSALKRGLRLRIWRGEESAIFNIGCRGSRAAFGALDPAALDFCADGTSLGEVIRRRGWNTDVVSTRSRTFTQAEIDSIAGHVELHIEQANALEQQGLDIGVVTSIRGPYRFRLEVEGRFDHSGGTPLGPDYRRDANLALAYMQVAIDVLGRAAIEKGHDLVQTIGVINSDPGFNQREPRVYQNAMAKVSGYAYCTVDVRSIDEQFRTAHVEKITAEINETADRFRVQTRMTLLGQSRPFAALDPQIQRLTTAAAEKHGYGVISMACGAMHDCVYVGEQRRSDGSQVPIGMIFIPCRNGISHAPDEYTSYEALAKGANVLTSTMYAIAS